MKTPNVVIYIIDKLPSDGPVPVGNGELRMTNLHAVLLLLLMMLILCWSECEAMNGFPFSLICDKLFFFLVFFQHLPWPY